MKKNKWILGLLLLLASLIYFKFLRHLPHLTPFHVFPNSGKSAQQRSPKVKEGQRAPRVQVQTNPEVSDHLLDREENWRQLLTKMEKQWGKSPSIRAGMGGEMQEMLFPPHSIQGHSVWAVARDLFAQFPNLSANLFPPEVTVNFQSAKAITSRQTTNTEVQLYLNAYYNDFKLPGHLTVVLDRQRQQLKAIRNRVPWLKHINPCQNYDLPQALEILGKFHAIKIQRILQVKKMIFPDAQWTGTKSYQVNYLLTYQGKQRVFQAHIDLCQGEVRSTHPVELE